MGLQGVVGVRGGLLGVVVRVRQRVGPLLAQQKVLDELFLLVECVFVRSVCEFLSMSIVLSVPTPDTYVHTP